jgi:hypothetical protein
MLAIETLAGLVEDEERRGSYEGAGDDDELLLAL